MTLSRVDFPQPEGLVSATNSLGAHLSARRRILSFPRLDDATWVAVDESNSSYLDGTSPLPTALDAKHQADMQKMSALSGEAFDKAYLDLETSLFGPGHSYGAVAPLIGIICVVTRWREPGGSMRPC